MRTTEREKHLCCDGDDPTMTDGMNRFATFYMLLYIVHGHSVIADHFTHKAHDTVIYSEPGYLIGLRLYVRTHCRLQFQSVDSGCTLKPARRILSLARGVDVLCDLCGVS